MRLAQPLSSVMGWGKRLYYSEQDIRAFLGGIAMSQLHILQGISGTGKTSFPIAFARALGRRRRENYKLVEVQAGWRDRQDLIGYYNSFEGKFYETEFLTALYEARRPTFRDQIYIIILDEMNLSRPEQYFADFLSKLEQDAPELILNTDLERPSPKLFKKNDTLILPPNVWFIGTANQDETTLEFADQTYERAHVMELERSQESFDIPQPSPRYPISYNALTTAFKEAQKQHQSKATKAFDFLNDNLSKILESKFKIGWGNRLQPCYKKSDRFEPLDSQCFPCDCNSGKDYGRTEWGRRICGKCSERYPYIKLYDLGILKSWYDRQVGSVDRIFGRNV